MVKIRIIPCLDVKDGRVVKGINFLNLIDAGDPVEQAKHYSDNGADEICFLDISASLEDRDTMINVVKKTAQPPPFTCNLTYFLSCCFNKLPKCVYAVSVSVKFI